MIVVRFKVRCRPERIEQALVAFAEVIAPSRALDCVVSFDIARDIAEPDSIVAVEVFDDREALERQESLPEVQRILGELEGWLADPPEATIFHVSASEPHGG